MKYKTLKEHLKPIAIALSIFAIIRFALACIDNDGTNDVFSIMNVVIFLFLAIFYVYCFSGDYIRKKYIKNGIRLEGYIESAKESFNGRGENRYYLKISFYDGEKKIRNTEAYMGNPCKKLSSRKCSIYKLNGKYIEADFQLAPKKNKQYINIPITRTLL